MRSAKERHINSLLTTNMSQPDEKIIDDSITTAASSSHQDADGRITPSHKSPQRSSSIDEGDVNGPLETIAGLMGK